ncbi:MAG TPA: hypothetical protein VFZ84_08930 [Burkholderiales bacterium]
MTFDASTVIVLMLAAALAGALLGVLPEWRGLSGALPIHRYLRRTGASAPFEAELRCALCAGRQECAQRATPLADCPNAALFRKDASGTKAAPTA